MLEGWDHGGSPESLVSVLLNLMLGWKCWEFAFEMKAVGTAGDPTGGGDEGGGSSPEIQHPCNRGE